MLVPTLKLQIGGQHGLASTAVNISLLDRSRYFFFQVAPHLYSDAKWAPSTYTTSPKSRYCQESNSGPLGLPPGTLTTRPQMRSFYPDVLA
jgi:hypothetical protein